MGGTRWARSTFGVSPMAVKSFHIVPDNSNRNSDLARKYGADAVFPWNSGVGFAAAMNACSTLGGDEIVFWPGAYTITTTCTVNRPVTIRSATGNNTDVRLNASAAGGADTIVFTVTAAGDYAIIKDLTIIGDDSATPVDAVKVSGTGVEIRKCRFPSATAVDAATNPAISLEDDADDCKIVDNFIKDHQVAIQLNAAERTIVKNNFIISSDDAAIGVDALGACNNSIVDGNTFYMRGGTADVAVKVNNAALDITVSNNLVHEDCSDPISPGTQAGNADTVMYNNSITGAGTTVDGTSAAIANLVAVVYT